MGGGGGAQVRGEWGRGGLAVQGGGAGESEGEAGAEGEGEGREAVESGGEQDGG